MEIHVAKDGDDAAAGSASAPLLTINRAAALALPGDVVVVHEGTYREWVKPPHGGLDANRRIVFRAADGERVVIKGSEVADDWREVAPGVWATSVPNHVFGDFNPYLEELGGDWFIRPNQTGERLHLGEVYLDGVALREVTSLDEVREPAAVDPVVDDWTGLPHESSSDARDTSLVWHCAVDSAVTTLHVNLGGRNPAEHLLEFNVRRSVFYPVNNHVDHITVSGFEMAHAATPWAPPTADQPGMLGPNWSRGWIIEDNILHDSKCSAISLGKEIRSGHNYAVKRKDKPGYQYQLESVFTATDLGWSKERVGSHVVRNNVIFDCGQTGIVGHLGCGFSTISGNHIHTIATRREFYGHELGGIKLHAPIDVVISDNHIHDCVSAIWLDWQTQGTRVTRNVFHSNARDLFIEVSHGPYVVDHNVFGSKAALENFSQGGAYVNNLVLGSVRLEPVPDRPTPYHLPHSTKMAGYVGIFGGDDRIIGNVFAGDSSAQPYSARTVSTASRVGFGTDVYDDAPSTFDEYLVEVGKGWGDQQRFVEVMQPVTVAQNLYLPGNTPCRREDGAHTLAEGEIRLLTDEDGSVDLEFRLPTSFVLPAHAVVRGSQLGRVRVADTAFDSPDGSDLVLDTDLLGNPLSEDLGHPVGPLASLAPGTQVVRIWPLPTTNLPERRGTRAD